MVGSDNEREAPATILCKSCGLCCNGKLFAWVKLRSPEVASATSLGLNVIGSHPKNRGFNQPCPLWNGLCTIYTSPDYPRSCRTYQCKLLKRLLDGSNSLSEAITVVQQAKKMIQTVESLLPVSSNCNFRERLVAHMESGNANPEFQQKAGILLSFYKSEFGVQDILNISEEI
jgi:hypothetical protein